MEVWKSTPLAPDHVEVSSLGRVRTLARAAPSKRALQPTQIKAGKLLSPWVDRRGYYMVSIKVGDKRPKYSVHRLIASAFCDGYTEDLHVNHKDGNKLNNSPANLEWVTKGQNTEHAWRTGLVNLRGERQPGHKLIEPEVRRIRAMVADGLHPRQIAQQFGVSETTVYFIKQGKRWASVT